MPQGKPAGVRCVNLDAANLCTIWGTEAYPVVCRNFRPEPLVCGDTNEQAFQLIADLEKATQPRNAFTGAF